MPQFFLIKNNEAVAPFVGAGSQKFERAPMQKIKDFDQKAKLEKVGQVISVGDGIAQAYGLDTVKAGEMVEFESGIKGLVLNLEEVTQIYHLITHLIFTDL